jgi:hypothetical protein
MALTYYETQDLDSFFIDPSTGQPLAGGILTFYQNSQPNVMVPVYEQTGTPGAPTYVPLPNPLTLSNVGTVQDSSGNNVVIYYLPNSTVPGMGSPDLYYVTVTDSGGNPVLSRYNWPNITSSSGPPPPTPETEFSSINQISNPTFTNSFLSGLPSTYTATSTATTYPLCPDWNLTIIGSGTVVINILPVTGNSKTPSSPPYVLDVAVASTVTSCIVSQNFYNNSGLWTSTATENIFLNGAFVAANQTTGNTGVSMWYAESTAGYSPVLIVNGTVTSTFTMISGSTESAIPASSNPNGGPSQYVTIYLSFIAGSEVQVSGVQLIVSEATAITIDSSDYNSSNRNEAYQGDYYIPRLNAKQISSYLVGWDFPLNPFQFAPSSTYASPGPIYTTAKYILDQTIAQSATSYVNWRRDTATNGLNMTGTGANDAFYILQYLSAAQVQSMVNNKLSVNVYGSITNGSNPVTVQIFLYSALSSATIPVLSGTIGTVNTTGLFTATAPGWTQVSRSGLPTPSFSLTTQSSYLNNDYGFNGWKMPGSASYFAVVVTFAYINNLTNFTINSISVVPGDIPSRPAVQSPDEVLRQCQYYYENNFPNTGIPSLPLGYASITLSLLFYNPNSRNYAYPSNFGFNFKQTKRVPPVVTFYSIYGAANQIQYLYTKGPAVAIPISGTNPYFDLITNYVQVISVDSIFLTFNLSVVTVIASFDTGSTGTNFSNGGNILFYYVCESRLGIV